MRRLKFILITMIALVSSSCQSKIKNKKTIVQDTKVRTQELGQYETAYFASGCFWCVEAIFESVKGVKEAISGYSGGLEKNPTYEEVGRGLTHHAEAVEVFYDPKEVSYESLVKVFFGSMDPTALNYQGPDRGPQYRSIAFYKNDSEKKIIEDYISKLKKEKIYDKPIVTQVVKFTRFYKAEDYHQDYEKHHPNNPYIVNVSIPRLERFKKKYPELLKQDWR
ncbi:peptide-methionine (S)-S-oxide reductase MsrA [Flavobacteriaceae bacterium F89]|uniref:Peptide methionine sulfoxide reductase MsrA n=1 Tax=Cerina litoralis TaxID=2874477 RepID=A0AAE3JPA5_9FLAO|nr:peptide-methionine (S)-S-oxide reductase MsrA [Cerina litoralis]MCG2461940.1 peptide-methionine (S)-S-oxide reductase MsrA [Cerina litoralis]